MILNSSQIAFLILAVLSPCLVFAKPKVKEDYAQLGVEGPTTVEVNIPNIDRESSHLDDRSYRFTLTPNFTFWPLKEHPLWGKSGITAAYVGIYDFYFGTKESGPVISRLQNPFLYLFVEFPLIKDYRHKHSLGVGHESNGQIINSKTSFDYFTEAYSDSIHGLKDSGEDLKYSDYNLEDWVSMGWNYYFYNFKILKDSFFTPEFTISLLTEMRWFFTHGTLSPSSRKLEEDVFYDEKLSGKTSIRDYDGLRYRMVIEGDSRHFNFYKEYHLVYDPRFEIAMRHGYLGRSFHPTFEYTVGMKLLGSLPIFYSFKHGYGRDMSNYPYGFYSHSIGVEFR